MTLKKIRQLNHFVKLAPLCEAVGMNVETLKARLKRGSPELTKEESMAIVRVIEKMLKDFKSVPSNKRGVEITKQYLESR